MSKIREGVIAAGEYSGWKMIVDDDSDGSTGGYFLYIKSDFDGFDYWFESQRELQNQLLDFAVEWID